MTFTPLQLSLNSIPNEVGSVLSGLKYRLDPIKGAFRKPGLHVFGPHFFSSHGDYFSYEVLTAATISHMIYPSSRSKQMANIYGLKIALGNATAALYDAAEVSTVRQATEKLGASHPAVQAFRRITKAIDAHMAANPPSRAIARGHKGMIVH